MVRINCKCKICGRDYTYEVGGEAGYSRDICSSYCDGRFGAARVCAEIADTMASRNVGDEIREHFGLPKAG